MTVYSVIAPHARPLTPYDVPKLRTLDTALCTALIAVQVATGAVAAAIAPAAAANAERMCLTDHPVCDPSVSYAAVVVLAVSVVVLAVVAIIGGVQSRRSRRLARPLVQLTATAQTLLIVGCVFAAQTGVTPAG